MEEVSENHSESILLQKLQTKHLTFHHIFNIDGMIHHTQNPLIFDFCTEVGRTVSMVLKMALSKRTPDSVILRLMSDNFTCSMSVSFSFPISYFSKTKSRYLLGVS